MLVAIVGDTTLGRGVAEALIIVALASLVKPEIAAGSCSDTRTILLKLIMAG